MSPWALFFFQAEDGIRDVAVTGVQTCALPISIGEHTAAANTRVHVTIMLETKRAFTRLDEIAAVPGIDALTIGPTDLAQDLGVLGTPAQRRSEEHTSELQSRLHLVCRLLLEKKKKRKQYTHHTATRR